MRNKTTDLTLVRDAQRVDPQMGQITHGAAMVSLLELMHRGRQISEAFTARRQMRSAG